MSNKIVEKIQENYADFIICTKEFRGEHTVVIKKEALRAVMLYCRDHLDLNFLVDVCSVDHECVEPRFEVVYEIAKIDNSDRIRIKVPVAEDEEVATVSDIWATANWHEREVYDLMGIRFADHPNMKRILMWEGYPYHPLRKEFPLAGKPTDMPDAPRTGVAPMEGGPFVASVGGCGKAPSAPRAKGES